MEPLVYVGTENVAGYFPYYHHVDRAKHGLTSLICLLTGYLCLGQIPTTELFVFQLVRGDSITWHVHSPQYLSAWNPGGYTNQPEWIDNQTLLVSARKANQDQNDIYHLDLSGSRITRFTATDESEYSPLVSGDGSSFFVVRQAHGDSINQQIYAYSLDLDGPGIPILQGVRNVGYYCMLTNESYGLFLVGEPPKLALMTTGDKTPRVYSSNIGRCLKRAGDGSLSYVHKYSDSYWFLKEMEVASKRSKILVETLPGEEDFTIDQNGVYYMGSGSVLYAFDPKLSGAKWIRIADLGIFGVKEITRLAVSKAGGLAVVSIIPAASDHGR